MLCRDGHQTVQRALVDRLQGGQAAEVGGAHQVRIFQSSTAPHSSSSVATNWEQK